MKTLFMDKTHIRILGRCFRVCLLRHWVAEKGGLVGVGHSTVPRSLPHESIPPKAA